MEQAKTYPPGVPCWIDIEPVDADGAMDFDRGLFGWESGDLGDGNAMWRRRGYAAATAERLGATVVAGPISTEWTRSAAVADRHGAVFALSRFDPH